MKQVGLLSRMVQTLGNDVVNTFIFFGFKTNCFGSRRGRHATDYWQDKKESCTINNKKKKQLDNLKI